MRSVSPTLESTPRRYALLLLPACPLLAITLLLEYGVRRWWLRHLSHPGLHDRLLQLAMHGPQLLRGNGAVAS